MRFIIVTGMSGAGKSTVLKFLEDIGFFCVDNLPPSLIPKFVELCESPNSGMDKVALGIDIRGGRLFGELFNFLNEVRSETSKYEILFLDCSDEVLLKRYKETRRSHPLASKGERIIMGIKRERELLRDIKTRADFIINTSNMLTRELRVQLSSIFLDDDRFESLMITVLSFGFKYGIPADCDLVFDVRFLPNPYYEMSLRERNGTDPEVRDYVFRGGTADVLMRYLTGMIDFLLPRYIAEGKANLIISIGCTGGKHRSVAITEALSEHLRRKEYGVVTMHRDYQR